MKYIIINNFNIILFNTCVYIYRLWVVCAFDKSFLYTGKPLWWPNGRATSLDVVGHGFKSRLHPSSNNILKIYLLSYEAVNNNNI